MSSCWLLSLFTQEKIQVYEQFQSDNAFILNHLGVETVESGYGEHDGRNGTEPTLPPL